MPSDEFSAIFCKLFTILFFESLTLAKLQSGQQKGTSYFFRNRNFLDSIRPMSCISSSGGTGIQVEFGGLREHFETLQCEGGLSIARLFAHDYQNNFSDFPWINR